MYLLRTCFGALALVLSSFGSPAFSQTWTVERVQGSAWVQDGAKRSPLEVGRPVPMGVQIITAAGGRVKLAGPDGAMMLGPNTSLEMRPGLNGLKTTAVQRVGMVEFDLMKRRQPYFSVETPAMAAMVKGTRFLVVASGWRSYVGVRQGVVQVQDFKSGQSATLLPGDRAATRETRVGLVVAGSEAAPAVIPGEPRAPLVRPERRVQAPSLETGWKIREDGWATEATEEDRADAEEKKAAAAEKASRLEKPGVAEANNGRGQAGINRGAAAGRLGAGANSRDDDDDRDEDDSDDSDRGDNDRGGNDRGGGSGNAGGNGNSNAGANGNGNSNVGGNGNGNAGGKGNGVGRDRDNDRDNDDDSDDDDGDDDDSDEGEDD